MTVQELIDALQKIKSKDKLITCSLTLENAEGFLKESTFGNNEVQVKEFAYVVDLSFITGTPVHYRCETYE